MDKYVNLTSHELDDIVGGGSIAESFRGKPHFSKPVIGLPTPVKPKAVTI